MYTSYILLLYYNNDYNIIFNIQPRTKYAINSIKTNSYTSTAYSNVDISSSLRCKCTQVKLL